MKLKTGDLIYVIAGKDKGKKGTITRVLPEAGRIAVAGVNAYKKHVKPSTKNPKGGIITLYRPLNASNAMIMCSNCNKPTRIGYTVENGTKTRVCRKCHVELTQKQA